MENQQSERLESLDVLRGFDLFCLVFFQPVLNALGRAGLLFLFMSVIWILSSCDKNRVSLNLTQKTEWEYERSFTVDEAFLEKDKILLDCRGLDVICELYLNNVLIANTQNMFIEYEFDVKPNFPIITSICFPVRLKRYMSFLLKFPTKNSEKGFL